jgi:trehalose/maltose hydrolase-like predicted phosphorylase
MSNAAETAERESLLGLGNGVLFARASAPEAAFGAAAVQDQSSAPYPGLYLAGFYNHARRRIAGENVTITALVNLPDPFGLSFRLESKAQWLGEGAGKLEGYEHRLNLAAGLTERRFVLCDGDGNRSRIEETRCVSLARPELALLRWRVTPLNWSGPVVAAARLQRTARNARLSRTRAYEGQHLEVSAIPAPSWLGSCGAAIEARTTDGRRRLQILTALFALPASEALAAPEPGPGEPLERRLRLQACEGEAFELERWVLVCEGAPEQTRFDAHLWLAGQREAWHELWQGVQIEAPGDAELERACRFIACHLLQTASPMSARLDVGFPSRGWQEGYFGHVFWDETFAFPFLSSRFPDIAKGLLDYRYRRLDAARRAARDAGCEGAMYPWRSAASGQEETPPYQWIPPAHRWKRDHTRLQRHIGAAIAFNLWHHHLATDDRRLLVERTGVMLVEIARFWASALVEGEDGRVGIPGVIGPDEYHDAYPGARKPGLNDNAYTNAMAGWALECAARLPERLGAAEWQELAARAAVRPREPERWDALSRRLRLPLLEADVLAQFEGYEALLPADSERLPPRHEDEREDWWLLERKDDINRYQVTKQADVLMLFYLLGHDDADRLAERMGYRLAPGWQARTIAHYLERISHESSLSRIVTAGVLAGIDAESSWRHYRQALETDLGPRRSASTHEGLHFGAMGGCWDVLQRHYLGLHLQETGVRLQPCPPPSLDDVGLRVKIRGRRLHLQLRGKSLRLSHEGGVQAGLQVAFADDKTLLESGRSVEFAVR